MKLILKENVENLGEMGSIVNVAAGYGRNYLLPRDLAVEANQRNIKQYEHQKNAIMARVKKVKATADDHALKLSKVSLTIEAKAGEENKLYGSVTTKDIAAAIFEKGFEVDRRKIVLDEPIKKLGDYEIKVKVFQDVAATIKLSVVKSAEEAKTETVETAEVKTVTENTEPNSLIDG